MAPSDEPLVKIATFPNEPLARLCAGLLEESGIRVLLKAGGVGVGGWASAYNLEHTLYVLAADADQAREILASGQEAPGGEG